MSDKERLAAKKRGEICFVWDCPSPEPDYPVVWICSRRHVITIWYCRSCGPRMLAAALRCAILEGIYLVCEECPGVMLMTPYPFRAGPGGYRSALQN